jgi:hypothetical protein
LSLESPIHEYEIRIGDGWGEMKMQNADADAEQTGDPVFGFGKSFPCR